MKQGIHPKAQKTIATCSCGATFAFDSTAEGKIKTEICSACHPFYTGKQKLVDTAGKVDKFRARQKAAKAVGDSKKRKISESVKAAAAASAVIRGSAVDSAKTVERVKGAAKKRELAKAKVEEDVKTEKGTKEKDVKDAKLGKDDKEGKGKETAEEKTGEGKKNED
ncbi:MAG: 50S ribosomal protein L31 [Patescibacteria group bacterium]